MAEMKATFIALLAVLLCLPAVGADKKPLTKEESAKIIEAEIRYELNKPTGELTTADWEKVTKLGLYGKELTEVPKGLEKLTQLEDLWLEDNPDLTKAQIDELKKSLPNCNILSNPKK